MSVSALFFTPPTEAGAPISSLWFPKNAQGVCEVFHVSPLPQNIDPSLNFVLARGIFEKSTNTPISSSDDYIKALNSEDRVFHSKLHVVNGCDTLIDLRTSSDAPAGSPSKIFFLAITQKLVEDLDLTEVHISSDVNTLAQESQEFLAKHNAVAYLQENLYKAKTNFCILNSEDFLSFTHIYEGLFQGFLQSENQKWISISLVEMTPIDEALFSSIKGFVVTGSHHDAYDTSMPWVPVAYELFKKIIYPENENDQKLIGVCWGHQAIGNGCGGKSSRMPHLQKFQFRDEIQFKQGESVKLNGESINFSKLLDSPFYAVKCHGDYVYELAKDATLIASSNRVEIEAMSIRNRALTFQFHPEFNQMILLKIIDEAKGDKEDSEQQWKAAVDSFKTESHLSNNGLQYYLKQFIAS